MKIFVIGYKYKKIAKIVLQSESQLCIIKIIDNLDDIILIVLV